MQHISLFHSFDHVYLFGSILNGNKYPEDIDLLLVYSEYSNIIIDDMDHIYSALKEKVPLPVDLTVLSFEELIDTDFLGKVMTYLQLK